MVHSMTTLFSLKFSVTRGSLCYFYFCTKDTKFHKTLDLGNEDLIWRQIALEPHKTGWGKTKGRITENQRASGRNWAQDASGGRETLWKWASSCWGTDSDLGYIQNNLDKIANGGVKVRGNQKGEHEGSMHWWTWELGESGNLGMHVGFENERIEAMMLNLRRLTVIIIVMTNYVGGVSQDISGTQEDRKVMMC